MKFINKLPVKNIIYKSSRSVSLLIFSTLLSIIITGGTLTIMSLNNGLKSLEKRLGADIIVVPYEARVKENLESLLLNGNRTVFYMDSEYLDKIKNTKGVKAASPQIFLSTINAGCCSVPIQIIGFAPDTDFTIQPWATESYRKPLKDDEILIGSKLTYPDDNILRFYDIPCRVKAQLKETGTGLDTAVYANLNTLNKLLEAASKNQYSPVSRTDIKNKISTVLVKVEDDYEINDVLAYINQHNRNVSAIKTKAMTSEIAENLESISRIIAALTAVIWILSIVIMLIVFNMLMNERRKEFAALRLIGVSQKKLAGLVTEESVIISLLGALLGIFAVLIFSLPFKNLIQEKLSMPFLLPGFLQITVISLLTVLISALAGAVSSLHAAIKISRQDAGLILREAN